MKRFNWLAAGRRWRKTTLVMAIAVEAALRGRQIIWGAPTIDQVRIGYKETEKACGSYADFLKQEKTAHFPGDGSIIFRSLDNPDNARGHTADGVVIDEAGDVEPDAWYEVLRPMLIDTGGWAWIIGTFKGLNWFALEHGNAIEADDAVSWQAPTLGCQIQGKDLIRKPHPLENPNIPFSEVLTLFQEQPEAIFRQEILSEIITGEGAVFRNIKANLYEGDKQKHKGHNIVAGVDWGQVNDFTVISVVCEDCRKEVELDRFNQIDWNFQRERLKVVFDRWGITQAQVELNSIGSPNFESLCEMGLPVSGFTMTAQSKPQVIQSLALALEREETKWLDIPIATRELEAYEAKRSEATGRITYNAPSGFHDDTVIARALANDILNRGIGVFI